MAQMLHKLTKNMDTHQYQAVLMTFDLCSKIA